MSSQFLSMLSITRKAGNVLTGDFQVSDAIRKDLVELVIVATDSGKNTKKKFSNSCFYYKVDIVEFSTKEEMTKAISKANTAVLAIKDKNLADKILSVIKNDLGDEFENKYTKYNKEDFVESFDFDDELDT